jgi:asparagine synthase (glutamine-hydrolysing)
MLVQEFGLEGLNRARGYFAVAIWDHHDKTLILASDQAGFKTLNYAMLPGRLAFASDYKALLALPDLVARPDREAVQHYLASLHPPVGSTLLADVKLVTGGEALLWRDGRCEKRRYWRPASSPVRRTPDADDSAVRESLLRVARQQSAAHSRIGITLSGGVDSPSVVAALRQVKPEAELVTFSAGFGEADPEISGAARVAEFFRTDHHSLVFDPETIPEELPRLIWLMEDCGAREEALLQLQVMREAANHVRFVMTGHGADAVFGSMPRHRLIRLAAILPTLSGPLSEVYCLTQIGTPPSTLLGRLMGRLVYKGTDLAPPRVMGVDAPSTAIWPSGLDDAVVGEILDMNSFGFLEPLHEAGHVDFSTPFLDPDFVDVSLSVPVSRRGTLLDQKAILRRAMSSMLPPETVSRPKAIQRLRHDRRLSDILDQMADDLLTQDSIRGRGLVDPNYLTLLRQRPSRTGYPLVRFYRLWALVSLEIWARQYVDGLGAPAGDRSWGTVLA